ncbi:MAG TPA: aldehyde dehydrogenase family protein [Deltaproteobacteria bacterium]|nr:aldehyde dehydrogenase family protein [Deltaproteobacteria bacterium]HCP47379.1 aldehyde dehydrogenase family protein [Deltaproteobacteria bacterium]
MAVQEIPHLVSSLRSAFDGGKSRPYAWRVQQLKRMRDLLKDNEAAIGDAMKTDLGKSHFEGWSSETNVLNDELDFTLKNLKMWMRPERVPTPLQLQPASCTILREPLGVVLVLGAWNYPIQLTLAPAIAAIAAGNCVVIKPSEVSPASAKLLCDLVPRYMDPDCVRIVDGGIPEATALLEQRFDHIFYTGGGTVGRIVMEAAAKHLCPVTLELGGKSPAIVDRSVNLKVAARRIARGKFWNAGQTCIAPDYVLVHESMEAPFLDAMKKAIQSFYGTNPEASDDFGRIINDRHFGRLTGLLEGQDVVAGGDVNAEARYIAPTVLKDVSPESPVMNEEIFGPILPVLSVADMDEAIGFINARPKPLALYLFTKSKSTQESVLSRTSSGGACVNETLFHFVPHDLPFGGVGGSGMGAYHGRFGFETFTHRKSVLNKSTAVDPPMAYPPFTESKQKWVRRLI